MNNKICLNMIVKNESKIILRLLESVISIIDCYCICDTGSTDNTIELITNYFNGKNINGLIFNEPFINFEYNRNIALQKCIGMSNYILLLDADMILSINNLFDKSKLINDCYYIFQGSEIFFYQNIRIIKNNGLFNYVGVTHEYIDKPKNITIGFITKNELFINDIGDGGSKNNKFERDIKLLKNGILNEPNNCRYYFYLANSYKDLEKYNEAIDYYKKVLELNNWVQEKYIACLRLYELYDKIKTPEIGIYYLIESYNYDNTRVEGIFQLIKFYCIKNQNQTAYMFYTLIQKYYENDYLTDNFNNKLFINSFDYAFYLPYYMIIVSERINNYDIGLKMYDIIFTKKIVNVNIFWIKNLIHNLYFFYSKTKDILFFNKWKDYLILVKNTFPDIENILINKYEFLIPIIK
jgi:tetratricopeptide (TPR) repeat protein